MKRHPARFAPYATIALLALVAAGCGSSGKREGQIGTAQTSAVVVQQGDPVLAAAPGYAGSATCAACHPNEFEGWGRSLHNAPLKTVAELGGGIFVNDANANGIDDFQDGLDLATTPAFDSFLGNAPRLSAAGGRFFATIGAVTYEVQRTQGGNGYWKQRYQTRIGRSYYVLPFQYNERSREYVQYNASHWYDGTAPRFTEAYGSDELVVQFGQLGSATNLGTQRSWENRCAGCHQTGLTVQAVATSYGGTDVEEAVTGYSELNIGCESCHGPGAAHAASRNPADIINPANFEALGVTGKRFANQVCGSCHSRGEGTATILSGASPLHLEYPARRVPPISGSVQLPLPGDSVVDNTAGNPFVVLNTTSAYYGVPPLPFFTRYGGWYTEYNFPTYIASRQHHQQWTDIEQGPHSADVGGTTCWSCHDPHKAAGNPDVDPGDDHQIRGTITQAGVTLSTRDDDNTLCLACHADFFGLTLNDVRIGGATVAGAVLSHMGKEAVMGDEHIAEQYDPAGTGIGRCSKCHMPKTASSAIRTAIGGDVREGDIRNHTFHIIWPSVNVLVDNSMANSCYSAGCHSPAPSIAGSQVIAEWSQSGHADFTGEPFRHWDADGAIPAACAKCHSKGGFNAFAFNDNAAVNPLAPTAPGSKISCGACHTEEGDGTTLWDERAVYTALDNVLFPSGDRASLGNDSNMCMVCHQGRASKVQVDAAIAAGGEGTLTFVNNHYFAAAATLFGTEVLGGYEYGDNVYVGRFAHTGSRDTCIECHMGRAADLQETNHSFEPKTTYCLPCHAFHVNNPSDPDNPFRDIRFGTLGIDFDGDGNVTEGIYFEIWDTLVPALYAQIQSYAATTIGTPIVYAPGVYPYWFIDTDADGVADPEEAVFANRYVAFDATLLKAAYNYTVVQNEPCGYVHNGRYVIQLLYDSIRDLGGDAAVAAFLRP